MKEILEIIRKHWFYPLHPMPEQTNLASEIESLYEGKLKEELIKFAQYINKIGWSIPKNEIDEYLKQHNNG
jgi:hypothetical protein